MPDSARFVSVAMEESCWSELGRGGDIDTFGMMVTYRRRMTEKRVTQGITKVMAFLSGDRFAQNFARDANCGLMRRNQYGLLK
jgi:hypothetical protein